MIWPIFPSIVFSTFFRFWKIQQHLSINTVNNRYSPSFHVWPCQDLGHNGTDVSCYTWKHEQKVYVCSIFIPGLSLMEGLKRSWCWKRWGCLHQTHAHTHTGGVVTQASGKKFSFFLCFSVKWPFTVKAERNSDSVLTLSQFVVRQWSQNDSRNITEQ